MLLNSLLILLGFVLLIKGGDWLVDGAVNIARKAKLSPMVIGITVIGFGTSMPELFVSLQAALAQSPGLSIGNVVGSNIANIALILGVTALIVPCTTRKLTLKTDLPLMVASCLMLTVIGMTGHIGRPAGIAAMAILIIFTSWEINHSRKLQKQQAPQNTTPEKIMPLWKAILLSLISFGLLVAGANLLIRGASEIAREIGQQAGTDPRELERIIGLTIVAVGTSLPELFASIMAARKKQADMAVGNIIGSVTFNILCGIGLTATICPIANSDRGFLTDYLLMSLLALLLWLFMRTRMLLERWEGLVLLFIYIAYVGYTVIV